MFDWFTVVGPYGRPPENVYRRFNKKTGHIQGEGAQILRAVGRDGVTTITVKFVAPDRIQLAGNPVKYLTGQNLIGPLDAVPLLAEWFRDVCAKLHLEPTPEAVDQWQEGANLRLLRVDVAGYLRLPSQGWKVPVVQALKRHFTVLPVRLNAYAFHYVAVTRPKRKKLTAYDKEKESRGFTKLPKRLLNDKALLRVVSKALRIELQLFSTELGKNDGYLRDPRNWTNSLAREILRQELIALSVGAAAIVGVASKRKKLTPRLRLLLRAWQRGVDILDGLSRNTARKRIREFAALGYDIQQPYEGPGDPKYDLADLLRNARLALGFPSRYRRWGRLRRLLRRERRG